MPNLQAVLREEIRRLARREVRSELQATKKAVSQYRRDIAQLKRMRDWWKRAERKAGLAPRRGRGWHSLRREFASDLIDARPKDLCQLGGWEDYNTILKCYQFADQNRLATTLANRAGSDEPPTDGGERAQSGPVEEVPAEKPKLRLIK